MHSGHLRRCLKPTVPGWIQIHRTAEAELAHLPWPLLANHTERPESPTPSCRISSDALLGRDGLARWFALFGFIFLKTDELEFTEFRGVAILRIDEDRLGRLPADLRARDLSHHW